MERLRSTRRTLAGGRVNYVVHAVRFAMVREAGAPDPRRIRTPEEAQAALAELGALPDDGKEHFGVLLLNAQNALVAHHEVSVGTLSASLVHPREVFGPALRLLGVAALVLVHNHPSGDPTPSREDLRLTRQLVEAGQLLDVRVHDHLIVGTGSGRWFSLAAGGHLGA